jgi:hypothetical protein
VESDGGGVGAKAVGAGVGVNPAGMTAAGRVASARTAITETPQCIGLVQPCAGAVMARAGTAARWP